MKRIGRFAPFFRFVGTLLIVNLIYSCLYAIIAFLIDPSDSVNSTADKSNILIVALGLFILFGAWLVIASIITWVAATRYRVKNISRLFVSIGAIFSIGMFFYLLLTELRDSFSLFTAIALFSFCIQPVLVAWLTLQVIANWPIIRVKLRIHRTISK